MSFTGHYFKSFSHPCQAKGYQLAPFIFLSKNKVKCTAEKKLVCGRHATDKPVSGAPVHQTQKAGNPHAKLAVIQ